MGALMLNARMSSLYPCQPATHPSPRAWQSLCLPCINMEASQAALPHLPAVCAPEETVYRPGLSDAPSFKEGLTCLAWQEKREADTSSAVGTLVFPPDR